MIFRTIKDDATGATTSIRLFGKTFTELKNTISSIKTNGLFKSYVINDSDVKCIEKYNTLIEGGIPHLEAMEQATKGASDSTAKMIKNANGNTIALNQMTLGAKAASVAMNVLSTVGNMLLIAAITKGVEWLVTYNQRLEETRQEMIAVGKEAAQLTKDLDDLTEQYRKLGEDGKFDNSDREQAKNIQEQINSLLGDEVHYIDLANGGYEEQLKWLRKIQHEKANENYSAITDAKDAADESLRSKGSGIVDTGFNENINGKWETDAVKELLDKEGFSKYINETLGGFYVGNYYNNSAEDFIESYNDMIELRTKLSKSYSDEIKEGEKLHDFYKNLDQKIKDMADAVTKYQDALDDYNINESVIQFNETDFGGVKGALIENEEQLKSWINAMLDSNDISDGVKENLIGLANVRLPQYGDAIKETIQAHIELKAKSLDSQNVLDGEIGELYKLGVQSGLTNKEIVDLISTQIIFNNTSLNIAGKVQALAELAAQLGITTSAAIGLNNALAGNTDPTGRSQMYNTAQAYGVKWDVKGWSYNGTVYKSMGAAIQAAMAAEARGWVGGNVNGDTPPYSTSGDKDKGSSKDDTPDYEDPTDAIIDRINLRHRELEQQEEHIENALEIAELENDYKKQISLTNDLIATRKQRVDELNAANAGLHNEAEYLRNSNPWDEESWFDSQGNATEAYYNVLNSTKTKEEQEQIKELFEKLSKYKKAYVDNTEEIADINKDILQSEKDLADLRWDNSNNWIDRRNHFNDWHLFNDSEVEAWERVVKWLKEEYPNELDKIQEAEENLFDARQKLVEDFLDELHQNIDDSYDIRIERLNSQSSLLSSHFDIVNAIAEEQHNLNKELREAETIGARMNEQERETLFTKQEHARLSGKLNDIMLDITDLQGDYQRDLATATQDTIEEITNNYERQYELKMKEYEIVRAELDLFKKQQILENVENEKSVRTWNGSSWVYEANLQDVLDAQEELANAEYELEKAKIEELQRHELNALDANADALQTEKNRLATAIDEMAEKMEGSGKEITDMLKTIAETDLPAFDAIIRAFGGSIKKAANISDEDINGYRTSGENKIIARMQERSKAWHTASDSEKTYLAEANRIDGEMIGLTRDASGVWRRKDGSRAYASGTPNAKKGVGLFDENGFGSELILTNDGVLTQFNGGERVFSPEMADRLWEMAQQNYSFTPVISQPDLSRIVPVEEKINNMMSNISNAFGDTYMIKDVQLNESEGGTLKGFMDFLKKKI